MNPITDCMTVKLSKPKSQGTGKKFFPEIFSVLKKHEKNKSSFKLKNQIFFSITKSLQKGLKFVMY